MASSLRAPPREPPGTPVGVSRESTNSPDGSFSASRPSTSSPEDAASSSSTLRASNDSLDATLRPPGTRRSRLLGLARATRDTYIPRLATSVSSLASGVAPRSSEIVYDEYGSPIVFPGETTFTLFPSYTRVVAADASPAGVPGYVVSVRGWMWCPGLMTRKNRLVLSLAKQVTKSRSSRAAQAAVEKLTETRDSRESWDDVADLESMVSSDGAGSSVGTSTTSVASELACVDQLIKERLGAFIARSIAKAHLEVTVGAHDPATTNPDDLCRQSLFTDTSGHFECDIFTPYQPSVVQVTARHDDTVTCCQEVHIMPLAGYGVISDIDDTVKLTGVIGDKRELLAKILVGEISAWNIPAVVAWYQDIYARLGATFHYVSNSPWQLFTLISQYFDAVKLPRGSVHLKQYSGNIITSLMEPSSSRKSGALRKILQDFPDKKFICIGDSGEQDMEAYVELAKRHPDRIAAIFIRAVPNSFSIIDDAKVLSELQWMASDWEKRQANKPARTPSVPDLIDLSDDPTAQERARKLPPMVPRKPASLKGNAVRKLPPLPERRYLLSNDNSNDSDMPSAPGIPLSTSKNSDSHSDETLLEARPPSPPSSSRLSTPPPPPPSRRRKPPVDEPETPSTSDLGQLGKKASENLASSYQANDFFELEDVDAKAAVWIQRLQEALHDLDGTNTKISFFEDSDADFFKDALKNF